MPDPQVIAEAIANLKELEQELLARLGNNPDDKRQGMNSAVGRLSFMDAFQQHQMDENAQRRAASQLTAVRAALKRVPDGTYGVCMNADATSPSSDRNTSLKPQPAHVAPSNISPTTQSVHP